MTDVTWIAIDERMPPEGVPCLVYAPAATGGVPSFMAVMTWTALKGWWPGVGDRVTHWTPAPAPPRA